MDTVSQLPADVITVKKVAIQDEALQQERDDEKFYDEKLVDAVPLAESSSDNGDDSAEVVRKLTSKQELIVFSACCISLFREYSLPNPVPVDR